MARKRMIIKRSEQKGELIRFDEVKTGDKFMTTDEKDFTNPKHLYLALDDVNNMVMDIGYGMKRIPFPTKDNRGQQTEVFVRYDGVIKCEVVKTHKIVEKKTIIPENTNTVVIAGMQFTIEEVNDYEGI